MRRNRKNNVRRERIIMIASSAFVLAALTMTGVYIREKNAESRDDGYTIDFTELDSSVDDKYQEIAQNTGTDAQQNTDVAMSGTGSDGAGQQTNMEDDLDYMPMEAGSHLVEIPGLTDSEGVLSEEEELSAGREDEKDEEEDRTAQDDEDDEDDGEEERETAGSSITVSRELHFSEADGLVRPSSGDILMHYSMDGSVYFATLQQYRRNPAVVFSEQEGNIVSACAEGRVIDVYEDARIGRAVTLDLGDGYQATYGQLKEIQVAPDSYVNPGDTIGSVAAPTKYFSVEGTNLYFELTKDGAPVNPEGLF